MNCLGGRQRSDKATGRNLFTDDLWNVCRRFPLLCRQRGKTPSVFAIRKCWLDLEPVRKPPNYHPKIKISFQRKNRLHLKQRFVVVEDKKEKRPSHLTAALGRIMSAHACLPCFPGRPNPRFVFCKITHLPCSAGSASDPSASVHTYPGLSRRTERRCWPAVEYHHSFRLNKKRSLFRREGKKEANARALSAWLLLCYSAGYI
jgi:hypothetical protein